MSSEYDATRRRILSIGGVSGAALLAGCGDQADNENRKESSESNETDTKTDEPTDNDTVVFTDTPTATPASELVFDGGTLDDFVDALREVSEGEYSTVRVEPGTYRFNPLEPVASGEKDPHAEIEELEDVTIEGEDATIVFTNPTRAGLRFHGGNDITVRGLTFDYDPVPFTQGEIVDIASDGRTITLALDDGYPSLSHDMFDRANRVWASVHNADGSLISGVRKDSSFDKFFSEITEVGDRRFELTIRNNPRGVEVGRRLTVVARNHGLVLSFLKVGSPKIEDITVRAGGGSAFGTAVCTDPVVRGTEIAPPPDSNRQIACDADGLRVVNCLSSTLVEDCRHDRLLDDSIVIQHTFAKVTEVVDDRTIEVENVHPFVVAEGDILGVQSVTGVRKGDLPPIANYTARFRTVGDRQKPATITFEESITDTVSSGDYVGNEATGTENFIVRNNDLRNHRGILVRVTAGPGTIEDNTLIGCSRNPVELESDTDGLFAAKGWCNDVTVRNNRIRRAGLAYFAGDHPAAIRCHHLTLPGTPTEGQPHRNIEIVGNDIVDCAGAGIDIEAAQDVRVEGNTLRRLNRLSYPAGGYGITVSNVTDIAVAENRVTDTNERLAEFGSQEAVEELSKTGNEFASGDESRAVAFRRWVPITFEFDRAVQPDDGRHLTVRCYKLRFSSGNETLSTYDIGVDEDGLRFTTGYFSPETADSGTWRWFGGENTTTQLSLPARVLNEADTLEIEAKPIETGMTGVVSIDKTTAGELSLDSEAVTWYQVDIPPQ